MRTTRRSAADLIEIRPTVTVKRTRRAVIAGRDEVLEAGLRLLEGH